jgi:hypothetical protein
MPQGFIPEIPPVRVLMSAQKIGAGGFAAIDAMIQQRSSRLAALAAVQNIIQGWSGTENKG